MSFAQRSPVGATLLRHAASAPHRIAVLEAFPSLPFGHLHHERTLRRPDPSGAARRALWGDSLDIQTRGGLRRDIIVVAPGRCTEAKNPSGPWCVTTAMHDGAPAIRPIRATLHAWQ